MCTSSPRFNQALGKSTGFHTAEVNILYVTRSGEVTRQLNVRPRDLSPSSMQDAGDSLVQPCMEMKEVSVHELLRSKAVI